MAKRRIELDDWLKFQAVGSPRVSPDGQRVAFIVSQSQQEANQNETAIWIYDRVSESTVPLTQGEHDREAVWSPDGRLLAFIAKRGGQERIYVIRPDGGEAKSVSDPLDGPFNLRWTPDGTALTVIAFGPESEESIADLAAALDSEGSAEGTFKSQKDTGLRITQRFPFRFDGIGYYDGRRRHLYQVTLSDGPKLVPLTSGEFDVSTYVWHPLDYSLTFTVLASGDDMHHQTICRMVPGQPFEELVDPLGEVSGMAWSPDGRYLAWIGDDSRYGWGTEKQLWLYDSEKSLVENLTATLDRQIGEVPHGDVRGFEGTSVPIWSLDGMCVFAEVHDRGVGQIVAVSLESRTVNMVLSDWAGVAHSPTVGPDTIFFAGEVFHHPVELFQVALTGGECAQITHLNDGLLEQIDMGQYDKVSIERAGFTVEGWIGRPAGYASTNVYPLILYIHGGPHGGFGHVFRHEYLMEMARGRQVLFINPRGSQGYGQAFAAACMNDWGGEDFQDLMTVLDAVIATGTVDIKRLGVTGISYGGYMTNWTITHTTRFRAAISEMSVSNHLSMYAHSDIGPDFMQSELGAAPWEDGELLWERSPIRYAREVTTPTLFVAGAEDYRCPPEQGEAMYVALRRRGIPTAWVSFPHASHGFSASGSLEQRLQRRRLMAAWWERYL